MKILAISLMRLGDLVMHLGALKLLKEQSQAEIHLLINRECLGLVPLIPWVNQIYVFDRELAFRSISNSTMSTTAGFDHIEFLVNSINTQNFDQVFNLSHNRVSARFSDLINAKNKMGAQFSNGVAQAPGSHWEELMNEIPLRKGNVLFHQIDLVKGMLNVEGRTTALVETKKGRDEAFDTLSDRPIIAFQVFTSDEKKNWEVPRFFNVWMALLQSLPEYQCILLMTPHEKEVFFSQVQTALPQNCQVAVTSIEGAYSILLRSQLLVTGDTLIKHLAAEAKCPVLEISIGSSRFRETAVYGDGSLILSSRELCHPCDHSAECYRERKYCSDRIRSADISAIVPMMLNKDFKLIEGYSKQRHLDFIAYLPRFDHNHRWYAEELNSDVRKLTLEIAERYASAPDSGYSRFLMNTYGPKMVGDFHFILAECNRFEDLALIYQSASASELALPVSKIQERIESLVNSISEFNENANDVEKLMKLREEKNAVQRQKRLLIWISDALSRTKLKHDFFRQLIYQGGINEKGSRTTP